MDTSLRNGLIAGLAATVVLSVLLVLKSMMGVMPALDPILMIASMMGMPVTMGWVGHFVICTILWGGLYALLYERLPGDNPVLKGVALATAAWLVMMIVLMPMAGAGIFGMSLGMMAPVMTLVMHVIFGAVLGGAYQALGQEGGTAAAT